jgi:putative methionine-R-sulfoxide reductase with GAF domain
MIAVNDSYTAADKNVFAYFYRHEGATVEKILYLGVFANTYLGSVGLWPIRFHAGIASYSCASGDAYLVRVTQQNKSLYATAPT